MTTLTVTIDERADQSLQAMSQQSGIDLAEMASRLLRRAIRATQPKPIYDMAALTAAYAEFAEEDITLAEATVRDHGELLAHEDQA